MSLTLLKSLAEVTNRRNSKKRNVLDEQFHKLFDHLTEKLNVLTQERDEFFSANPDFFKRIKEEPDPKYDWQSDKRILAREKTWDLLGNIKILSEGVEMLNNVRRSYLASRLYYRDERDHEYFMQWFAKAVEIMNILLDRNDKEIVDNFVRLFEWEIKNARRKRA